jgi:dTDP-4-amino-4,6-dideoxygalactose transaminase
MNGVTRYTGIASFYFRHLLKQIVKTGGLDGNGATILDFGCGNGELKRLLGGRVIGFDIIPALSDVEDWRPAKFDVLVANQVFYSFNEKELEDLLIELRSRNPRLRLVVGVSRQGMLNNIGKYILGRPDAHSRTKISPRKEREILERYCDIVQSKNVLNLTNVYVLVFKSSSSQKIIHKANIDRFKRKIPRGIIYHNIGESIRYLFYSLFKPLDDNEEVRRFEISFARYCDRKHCTAFPFARTAIYFILKSLNLPKGSEVLMPPITIKGIVDVVLALGLAPRYVDLDPETICFDLEELSRKITPKVRVAIITPLFGLVPDVPAMVKLLRERQIFIMEDFSQCLNGRYAGRRIGTFGDVAIYSASSIKTLDTLGGGLAITDDDALDETLKKEQAGLLPSSREVLAKKAWINLIRNVATSNPVFTWLTFPALQLLRKINPASALKQTGSRDKSRIPSLPATWFRRFTSVQAKIGLEHIEGVAGMDRRRAAHVDFIKRAAPAAKFPRTTVASLNMYWQLIMHAADAAGSQRHFSRHGIDIATSSLELVCALEDYPNREPLANAEKIYRNGVLIPCYPDLRQEDVDRIVSALHTQSE